MFLGENATGKSSVLQAVALTLLGQEACDRLYLDARKFVRRGSETGEGLVRIHLSNVPQPTEMRFNSRHTRFIINPPQPMLLLLGFGATRVLPRPYHLQRINDRSQHVKNLFDPFSKLKHAERWLVDRNAVNDDQFNRIAIALRKLLMLDDIEDRRFTRNDKQVLVNLRDKNMSLSELSDGYQSIVVMAVNIIMGVMGRWKEIEFAEGVVLIDELEVHLHPSWKMKIVRLLRQVFPKMTFLVTTHDPLCLRGLFENEIIVLRCEKEGVIPQVITESIDHLRADQLLTSPLFGLVSTRDPKVTTQVDRYSILLGKPNRTAAEEIEFKKLGTELGDQLSTAETPVSRIVEKTFERTLNEIVLPELHKKLADFEINPETTVEARKAVANLLGLVKA